MFVTNRLTPDEMFSEILTLDRARGYDAASTSYFGELKHNRDLCPTFRDNLNILLEAYKRHGADAKDIQSFRDNGVDVLVDYRNLNGEARKFGLQIKDQREVAAWSSGLEKGALRGLKAQILEAQSNARVDFLYVILCIDEIKYQNKLRIIGGELQNVSNIKLVIPREAMSFHQMTAPEITGYVSRTLCKQDDTLQQAQDEVDLLGDQTAYFTLRLMQLAFEIPDGSYRLSERLFSDWTTNWRELAPRAETQDLSIVIEKLEEHGLSRSGGLLTIDIPQLPRAMLAIYVDLRSRYGKNFLEIMMTLLTIGEGGKHS